MGNRPDERPPHVQAAMWVSRITTVGVEMALPAGLGYWLDQKWNTEPWLVTCGAALGFVAGFWHLLSMLKNGNNSSKRPKSGNK